MYILYVCFVGFYGAPTQFKPYGGVTPCVAKHACTSHLVHIQAKREKENNYSYSKYRMLMFVNDLKKKYSVI
jgi:hypothetical protein